MWVKQPELIIPGAVGIHASNQIQAAQGAWSNGTDYVAGDLVQGDGDPDTLFYVCILANGPGGVGAQQPPNATYWRETIWTASAADLTTPSVSNWNDAIDKCLALEYAGYTDWRLPNMIEYCSIMDAEDKIDLTFFPNAMIASSKYYWSSTTLNYLTTWAMRILFRAQSVSGQAKTVATFYSRPVRGGIPSV